MNEPCTYANPGIIDPPSIEKLQEIMAEVAERMKPENRVVKWTVHPDRYEEILAAAHHPAANATHGPAHTLGYRLDFDLEKCVWIPKNRIIQHYADGHISILELE